MRIITIIPAYNEEKAIVHVVNGVKKYSDVLVVDDGSTDKTALLAKNVGAKVLNISNTLKKASLTKSQPAPFGSFLMSSL